MNLPCAAMLVFACVTIHASESQQSQNLVSLQNEAALLAFQCIALYPPAGQKPCSPAQAPSKGLALLMAEIPKAKGDLQSILNAAAEQFMQKTKPVCRKKTS